MLAQLAVVFEHVSARALVGGKICVQDFAQRGARDIERRAFDVALDVARESYRRHPDMRHFTQTVRDNESEAGSFLIIHLIDGTYELFRHFYAVPKARDRNGVEVGGGARRGRLDPRHVEQPASPRTSAWRPIT